MKKLYIILAVIGFFFPYFLQLSLSSANDELKVFALYLLPKFNLIYFAILIILFFAGLKKEFARITLILFVTFYFAYTFFSYFIYPKFAVENYIKSHDIKDAKIVKLTDLKNYPNFKIIYKYANLAVVRILPKKEKKLPFNYIKERSH